VKSLCFGLIAWTLLQGSSQAQSIFTTSRENKEARTLAAAIAEQPMPAIQPTRAMPTQRFVCNGGYTQKECHEQVGVLRKALERYPVTQLGDWTWILVRSEDWKALVRPRGLDPDSPAFTYSPKHETFVEEALVTQVAVRNRELLLKWNMNLDALLDVAIRHEMGHALCNDPSERSADRVADMLEQGKTIQCSAASK
jgi:hypothetical protein